MYAVIETGGKQYRVTEGDVINVEKLDAEVGKAVTINEVLVVEKDDEVLVGAPYVAGASVKADVVENGKGKKVVIYKYKAKKDSKKKQGHRQPYTMVEITAVAGEKAAPKKEEAPAEEVAESKPLSKMLKAELIDYAKENGIEIDEKATKAVIIEAIEAAK